MFVFQKSKKRENRNRNILIKYDLIKKIEMVHFV
jgi:hypothetical protein